MFARSRTVCAVLMLTTAGPCFSTSSVKSGRPRAWLYAQSGSSARRHRSSIFRIVTSFLLFTENYGQKPESSSLDRRPPQTADQGL